MEEGELGVGGRVKRRERVKRKTIAGDRILTIKSARVSSAALWLAIAVIVVGRRGVRGRWTRKTIPELPNKNPSYRIR